MYHYLERIQPEHLAHIAAQLYLEMLKSGYGCVGEFQYLHHGLDGTPYDNRAEMSLQCLQAARRVGIGFTALPVLYRYGGFGSAEPLDAQKRFLNDADGFIDIVQSLQSATAGDGNCSVGIAPHSLRAINFELLSDVIGSLQGLAAIHLHIAEQSKEVDDCLAWCDQRPVEWLYDNFAVDQNWCLIHATHMTRAETSMMADSGCVAGLCPTTEANLGDGYFNASEFFARKGDCAGLSTACACRQDAVTCWYRRPWPTPDATCSMVHSQVVHAPVVAISAASRPATALILWYSITTIRACMGANRMTCWIAGSFPETITWYATSMSVATSSSITDITPMKTRSRATTATRSINWPIRGYNLD